MTTKKDLISAITDMSYLKIENIIDKTFKEWVETPSDSSQVGIPDNVAELMRRNDYNAIQSFIFKLQKRLKDELPFKN